ncbi:hypothetical protein pb186bvf_016677 [Paramecium bursaria]
MKYLKYIKKADLFGVNYKPKLTIDDNEQQSLIGGCVTIALYSICFAYFLYVVVQWQIGRILPGTSSISKVQDYQEFTFNHTDLFEFSYWRYNNDLLDPFDPQNIIILPLAIVFVNGSPVKTINLLTNQTQISGVYNARLIKMEQLKLVQNVNAQIKQNETPIQEVLLILVQCDEQYLYAGQQCSSQSDFEKFWEQAVQYISFWVNLNQFNIYTKSIEVVKKQIYIAIEKTQNINGQFIFKPVQLTSDDGFIFEEINQSNFLSDVSILTITTSLNFFKKILGLQTYFSIFLRVDPIVQEVQVTYPKLGQILAEVGSISSTLLMIRYLIFKINEKLLEKRLIKRIVKIYYPNIGIKRDRYLIQKNFQDKAKSKLIITNIIKEINKIQRFIEYRYGLSALTQSQLDFRQMNGKIKSLIYKQDEFSVHNLRSYTP